MCHVEEVKEGKRRFENAFQAIARMILAGKIDKPVIRGKTLFDFSFFREGKKHVVAWHEEINSCVNYVKDAAEGGSSKEMALVLVGEPGNGKTFFVDFLCYKYRQFLSRPENRKFTFSFVSLDKLGGYGKIREAQSQTFEDPMILAMNLFSSQEKNMEFLASLGFSGADIDLMYDKHRPLGACSEYILHQIRGYCNDRPEEIFEFLRVDEVPIVESLGILTGKYSAKDKITASAVDLLGEESIQRLLNIADQNNPYKFDLRRGALARVAGGGIHFSDEIFKNKVDLVQVYLGVIQNRNIELDGYKWPIDTLIIATSNNEEFNRFTAEKEQAPIKDRCRVCFVGHNTDYLLQKELTMYSLGSETKTTLEKEKLHQDPNLNYAASVAVVLTRLPKVEKLDPIEIMKLAAGEVAGEKSIKALYEVIDDLSHSSDVTKRWGQKGMGQRDLGRALQILMELSETNEGKCMFAEDIFKALERVVYDYVADASYRDKYLADIKKAKTLYRERIMTEMFNAYMNEPLAIKRDVMNYVNMIIGISAENLGPDKMWKYRDPQTGEIKVLKIDEKYIQNVEERLGKKSKEERESFRTTLRKIYAQRMSIEPEYDFMDNLDLVKAVTDVRLQSDVGTAGSLVGALANRTNEENQKIYNRMIETMLKKLGYCVTCAQKTIEYFCTKDDES